MDEKLYISMVGFMDDVFVSVKQIARTFHSSLCRTNEKKRKKREKVASCKLITPKSRRGVEMIGNIISMGNKNRNQFERKLPRFDIPGEPKEGIIFRKTSITSKLDKIEQIYGHF